MTRNAAIVDSLKPFGKSVYASMSALAKEYDAADLGQGYPDEEGPIKVRELASKYLVEGPNQYTPPTGVLAFREAIVKKTKECYGIDVDAGSQVVVTAGAEEALTAAFIGLCEPGDEVVVIEPFYIPYLQKAAMVRATVRYVRPEGPSYTLSADLLRAQISDKTKLVVINSPGNPSGHVVSREELSMVGEVAQECGA